MTNKDWQEIRKLRKLGKLIAKKQRLDQKCTDCNEYNQEKHYCPKFCDVIRGTTKEIQEFYKGEHEKLERIEQIIKDYDTNCGLEEYMYLEQIKEVLNG